MKAGSKQFPWITLHKLRFFSLTFFGAHLLFHPSSVTPVNCPHSPSAAHYLKPPPLFPNSDAVCRNTFPPAFPHSHTFCFSAMPQCTNHLDDYLNSYLLIPTVHKIKRFWPTWPLLPLCLPLCLAGFFALRKSKTKNPKPNHKQTNPKFSD